MTLAIRYFAIAFVALSTVVAAGQDSLSRVPPQDEAAALPGFAQARRHFEAAVKNRSVSGVLAFVDADTSILVGTLLRGDHVRSGRDGGSMIRRAIFGSEPSCCSGTGLLPVGAPRMMSAHAEWLSQVGQAHRSMSSMTR
jgi:hypothetical protein